MKLFKLVSCSNFTVLVRIKCKYISKLWNMSCAISAIPCDLNTLIFAFKWALFNTKLNNKIHANNLKFYSTYK